MDCPICYEPMRSTFASTKCQHRWCLECHKKKIAYDQLCPLCRTPHDVDESPDYKLTSVEIILEYECNGVFDFPRPWRVKRRLRRRMRALRGS